MANALEVLQKSSGSKFLKALDLNNKEVKVTVSEVKQIEQEKDDGRKVPQLVLSFEGKEKNLGLNKTNLEMMIKFFGAETDEWIGKQIILYVVVTSMGDGIRVRNAEIPVEEIPLDEGF